MIYFLRCGRTKFVKIGMAKNVVCRIEELQAGSPYQLILLAVCKGGRADEKRLHNRFADERKSGEWFNLSDRLCDFILEQVPALDFYDRIGGNLRRSITLDPSFIVSAVQ